LKSGILFNDKDPIYDMSNEEFEKMLLQFNIELSHPIDLKNHSLIMWRTKWVFRIIDSKLFNVDKRTLEEFKENLIYG